MENRKSLKILREILYLSKTFFTAFMIAFFINHVLLVNASVPTGSMEPTVEAGSRIIANRLAYLGENTPERGDVICFWPPDGAWDEKGHKISYLKRVIALPGETVEGRDGNIYIDGELLTEDYISVAIERDFGPYAVPEESYFVMGDNRNNSWDSRYWRNKFVKRDAIIGRAELIYLPKWKAF